MSSPSTSDIPLPVPEVGTVDPIFGEVTEPLSKDYMARELAWRQGLSPQHPDWDDALAFYIRRPFDWLTFQRTQVQDPVS